MRRALVPLLLIAGCGAEAYEEPAVDDWIFTDGKADGLTLARQALDVSATEFIDLRGVGDSAWAGNKTPVPLAPRFGDALDQFDPTGASYRGDATFINWESVVGNGCTQFHADSFGFLSHPANLVQAFERGFNLVGLSNNHSRDCGDATSPEMTARAMAATSEGRSMAWHGVAREGQDPAAPSVLVVQAKGRAVRIAFASLYLGRDACPQATCRRDREQVLRALGEVDADLRVLAVHVLEFGADWEAVTAVGTEFIRDHDGDVVFGHGPHVWKPPLVVEKRDGTGHKGVVFTSLGNFIHPSLRGQARNLIGRALFDPDSLALRQIQLVTVATSGGAASFGTVSASEVGSFGAQRIPWSDFQDTVGTKALRGAFVNVP